MRVLLVLTLLVASSVEARTVSIQGSIDRILTDGSSYGGCMVLFQPEQPLSAYGLNCRNNYFTFDCRGDSGQPGGRAQAELNLQQAQLAMALNAQVQLVVTDNITIDGNCYSKRAVVLRPSE